MKTKFILTAMLCLLLSGQVAAQETSGTCGPNLTWQLSADGTLTISGTGDMDIWYNSSSVPWYSSRYDIKTVVIDSMVTSIGHGAFYDCGCLTSVTIPRRVTSIEGHAFNGCISLTSVIFPEGLTSIGGAAFQNCSSLTSATLPESMTSIGESAFQGCGNLTTLVLLGKQWPSILPNTFADIGYATLYVNTDAKPNSSNWRWFDLTYLRDAITVQPHVYNGEKAALTLTHTIPGYRVTPEWGDLNTETEAGQYELGEFKLWFTIEGSTDSLSALCSWPNYTYTIEQAEQEIRWTQDIAGEMIVGNEIELQATSTAGLEVVFTSSNENVIAVDYTAGKSKLICLSAGDAVITASQPGNKNYKVAPAVEKSIHVKTTTGISSVETGITVLSKPGEIVVHGASADEPLAIYDMQEHTVYSGHKKSIRVGGGKIYIVMIGRHHHKVFVP